MPGNWEEAWREGRTGWDAGDSPPILHALVREGGLPAGEALVAGCGSGYDVLNLADDDRRVTGVDLALTAVHRFERLRDQRGIDPANATMIAADFFEWEPGRRFDLIWDYTFFCAIAPSMRARWAERMDELLAEDGELVTLIFPVGDWAGPSDPPYRVSPELLTELLASRFEAHAMFAVQESFAGRVGHEWLGRWRRRRTPAVDD